MSITENNIYLKVVNLKKMEINYYNKIKFFLNKTDKKSIF